MCGDGVVMVFLIKNAGCPPCWTLLQVVFSSIALFRMRYCILQLRPSLVQISLVANAEILSVIINQH